MSKIVNIDRTLAEIERRPASITLNDDLIVLDHTDSWLGYIISEDNSVIGQSLYELIPEVRDQLEPLIAKALAGEPTYVTTIHLSRNDQPTCWDVSLEPRPRESTARILMIVHLLTDEKRLRRHLEQLVADRTRRLEALYGIASVAGQKMSLSVALQRCLQCVLHTGLGSAAIIYLWNDATQTAKMAAQLNFPMPQFVQSDRQQIKNKLMGACIEQKKTLILDDIHLDKRIPDAVWESGIHSIADVPMLPKGKTVGILSVFRDTKKKFDDHDIDLLEAVADQVGSIIQSFDLQQDHDRLLLQDERRRLADQLHDAVTQSLYSLTLYAGAIQQFADNGELERSLPYIEPLQSTAQRALREMRLMLHNLRPSALSDEGLVEALRQRLNSVERRANMQGQVITETKIVLAPKVEEQLYYIISEALNNTLKHASASKVSVVMEQSADSITASISDDGHGFNLNQAMQAGGLGLQSMRDRTEKLGGTLTFKPSAHGTTVEIYIPLSTALRSFDDKSISS